MRKNKQLPAGISERCGKYRWSIMVDGVRYSGTERTLDRAVKARETTKTKSLTELALEDIAQDPHSLLGAIRRLLDGDWSEESCKSHRHFITLTNNLLEFFGPAVLLSDISVARIDDYITWLKKEKRNSGASINRKLAALSKILHVAYAKDYIMKIPAIDRQAESEGRIRFITPEEETKMLAWCESWGYFSVRDSIIVLIDTGVRTGELFKATKDDVDPSQAAHGILTLHDTKNFSSRSIPLTLRASEALQRLLKESGDGQHFIWPRNQFWLRLAWEKMKLSLGYQDDKWFVPHILRHTCASRLVQNGVNLNLIGLWLGHRCLSTTRRYAHLHPEGLYALTGILEGIASKEQQKGNVF